MPVMAMMKSAVLNMYRSTDVQMFVGLSASVCRLSGKGKALGGVATFAGVGLGIVASLASFNSFDVHLMF